MSEKQQPEYNNNRFNKALEIEKYPPKHATENNNCCGCVTSATASCRGGLLMYLNGHKEVLIYIFCLQGLSTN